MISNEKEINESDTNSCFMACFVRQQLILKFFSAVKKTDINY